MGRETNGLSLSTRRLPTILSVQSGETISKNRIQGSCAEERIFQHDHEKTSQNMGALKNEEGHHTAILKENTACVRS